MNILETAILASGATAALITLIGKWLEIRMKGKEVVVSDSASFRQNLIDREKNLVNEVFSLAERCSKLETDLQDARKRIIDLEKKDAENEIVIRELRGKVIDSCDTKYH